MITHTYTKTYAIMNAWASTIPWDCHVRDTGCVHPTHRHTPMANAPCAVAECAQPLRVDETCYAVVELPAAIGADGYSHQQWVCWRHVRPDAGPIKADRP
jgi:hypothetical protein